MIDPKHGTVEVELAGETFVLEPTLEALQKLDRHFGSLRAAIQRCSELSLDALVTVIAAGSGATHKDMQRLPDLVFQAGVVNVAPQLTEYLMALLNPTGEKPQEGDEGKA